MYARKFSNQEKKSLVKIKNKKADKASQARLNEWSGTSCSDRRQLIETNWEAYGRKHMSLKETPPAPHTSAVPSVHGSTALPQGLSA